MRGAIHPMEQLYRNWEAKSRANRNAYWNACARARQEYLKDVEGDLSMSRPRLDYWVNERYGFQMEFDEIDGGISERFTITDPKKFMLFQIKHWL